MDLIDAMTDIGVMTLQWRDNEGDGVSNHQRPDFLPNRLF